MEEINRLHDIADDIGSTSWGRELADALHNIAELRRERDKLRDEAAWAESLSEILDEWADLLGFPEQKGDPGKITARVGAVLDGTWRRLMPEGVEWPRYEDGEPVLIGGEFMGKDGKTYTAKQIQFIGKCFSLYDFCDRNPQFNAFYGERVKRPAPKVLDVDGAEIRVGDEVWSVNTGMRYTVEKVTGESIRIELRSEIGTKVSLFPIQLTHQRPVFDADGVPIKVGDTVYEVGENYMPLIVSCLPEPGAYRAVKVVYPSGAFTSLDPERLTHTKPEPPDSWERLEDDATKLSPYYYARDVMGLDTDKMPPKESRRIDMMRDIVRRAKALAERSE